MRRLQVTPDGHTDAIWRPSLDRLGRTTPEELLARVAPGIARPRVLVVSAHPDDETLGGGRLIADWVRAGADVRAVVATAGEACFDSVGHHEPGIAQTRLEEWRRALDVLGVRAEGCLGLADGALSAHQDRLTDALRGFVDDVGPDIVAGTHRSDPHPDHGAVGRAIRVVAEERSLGAVEWPVWLTYFADPPGPPGLEVVTCSAHAERVRQAAWLCFPSQRLPVAEHLTAVVPPQMTGLLREQLIEAGRCAERGAHACRRAAGD